MSVAMQLELFDRRLVMENLAEQTQKYTDVGGDIVGDCWRTAIACLLEIPLDVVPHFAQIHKDDLEEAKYDWWWDTVGFVEYHRPGMTLVCNDPRFPAYVFPTEAPQRVILTGQSPRGDWLHSVIADAVTGDVVWDPHPSRAGVLTRVEIAALTNKTEADAS